jgi:hypothetical protein
MTTADPAGGWSKVQSATWLQTADTPIGRFYFRQCNFRTVRQRLQVLASRERPAVPPGLPPAKRLVAWSPRPSQLAPGTFVGRTCDHAPWPRFRPNIFRIYGRLSGRCVLLGNNGNMGTSHTRQAESRASERCEPVPKPSGRFGNMGT